MPKRPTPLYDFTAFGAAIKAARNEHGESRKKVCDELYISPRYLANIENDGRQPSLQVFYERYGNTDYNRNGKGNNGSRKNRGIIPLHGRLQRMAAAIFFCVKDKGTRNKYRLSNGIWSR